jgi:hypothetical protein
MTDAAVKFGNERSLMKTTVAQSGNVTAVAEDGVQSGNMTAVAD